MITFEVDDLREMTERVRGFADFLRRGGVSDEDVFASRIVSCELISNVILHGGEAALFRGEICDGGIVITVSASGFDKVDIKPSLPDVLAESGRGMYIVNCISLGNVEKICGGLNVTIKMKS